MKIIGAGFGRTGTMSLCEALNKLGYGPCYHFIELFKNPSHIKVWQSAADGDDVDWKALLKDYQSGLDYPIVGFYQELMAAFPDARVILTVRDPERWYESTIETIYQGTVIPQWFLQFIPSLRHINKMTDATAWDRIFDGRFKDRAYAIQKYNEHIQQVKEVVPADRFTGVQCQRWMAPPMQVSQCTRT